MFTIENHVGRLIELRMSSPLAIQDLAGFHESVAKVVGPHTKNVVVCTDLLGARVFPQPVTEKLTAIIRQESPRIDRNAFLVGEGAVFSMQMERIIREAGIENRKTFLDPGDLSAWLASVLIPAERSRLTEFLRAGVALRRDTK